MAEGKKKCDPPSHGNHMKNFEDAMQNALENWSGNGDENLNVRFQMTVSPNPGGVKEYRVVISSD
jgi:hypothetical protein